MPPTSPERGPRRSVAIVILVIALAAAAAAAFQFVKAVARLPQGQLAILGGTGRLADSERSALQAAPLELRSAFQAGVFGQQFAALQRGRLPAQAEAQLPGLASGLRNAALGRLQLAAVRMLAIERRGGTVADAWADLRVLLEGIEGADFRHDLQPVLDLLAAAYRQQKLAPGSAAGLAIERYGFTYGPWIQYLAPRLIALAQARAAADDPRAADLLRRLTLRWLRQWTLEPGPIGLRMLAADWLEQALTQLPAESQHAASQPAAESGAALARELADWRAGQRAAYLRLPDEIVGFAHGRSPAGEAHERYVDALVWLNWCAAAAVTAGLAVLAGGWFAFRAGGLAERPGRHLITGVLVVAVLLGLGWFWAGWFSQAVRQELRGDFSQWRYVWWHVVKPAVLTLGVLVLAAIGSRARRQGRATFAAMAVVMLLAASVGVVAAAWRMDGARAAYESALAEQLAGGAGSAESVLPGVRAWNP